MGQRLNIEIHKSGEVLANAYYHWSAYTSSSLALTQKIIDNLEAVQHDNDVIRAVRLLETTGALMTEEEKLFAQELVSEEFEVAKNRSYGLISIESGIESTRSFEEGRVEIDLESNEIYFSVFYENSKESFMEELNMDGNDMPEEEYEQLPILEFDDMGENLNIISFEEFPVFAQAILNSIQNKQYALRLKDSEDVISFIE